MTRSLFGTTLIFVFAITSVSHGQCSSCQVDSDDWATSSSAEHRTKSGRRSPGEQFSNNRHLSFDDTSNDDDNFPTERIADGVEPWQQEDQQRLLHAMEKKKNLIMFGLDSNDLDERSLRMLLVQMLQATEIEFESSEVVSVQKLPKTRFPHPPILIKLVSGSLQSMIIRSKSKLNQYNIRLENDLDSKTIRKQKRLVPLRNKLLEAHLPNVFIRYGKLFVHNQVLNSEQVDEYARQYNVRLAPPSRRRR